MKPLNLALLLSVVLIAVLTSTVLAADKKTNEAPAKPVVEAPVQDQGNRVDVQGIKQKYWARGDETEIGVVQNRQFSKSGKFQIGLMGGASLTDTFLSVKEGGGNVGYHFSEYFSANLLYWKYFVKNSGDLETFQDTRGATANTNEPKYYFGGEVTGSFLYGKLALFASKIIYFDMNVTGGVGMIDTETGKNFAPSIGLGQRYFLSKYFSLKVDYRMLVYHEDIPEKQITNKLGTIAGSRTNFSHNVTLGIDFLFGGR